MSPSPPPAATVDPPDLAVPRGSLGRAMAVTSAVNVPVLGINLATGVLTARLLAPSGRGEVAAVVAWVVVLDLLVSLGVREAATYLHAKGEHRREEITRTAIALAVVLGLVAVAVAQVVLPVALAAQRPHLVGEARVAVLMLLPMMLAGTGLALLNGHQRFAAAAGYRLVQPAIVLVGLVGLWIAGQVDVGPVLAVHAASWVVTLVLVALLLREDLHVGRPSRHVARASFAYGLRLHGQSLGSLATARLDVMVMPAILAPAQIGWYVVAVSAASLVVPLFGQVRSVVFAAGARHHRQRAIDITLMALRFSLLGSAAAAVVLGVVAPVILRLVYGDEFVAASTPLRILLPGIVAWCAAGVLTSGLNALGRPGVGSAAQGIGALATVVGLALTLPTLGIEGAAITSSVSYVAVFVVLWLAIRQEPGCSLAAAVSPFRLAADLRQLLASRRAGS